MNQMGAAEPVPASVSRLLARVFNCLPDMAEQIFARGRLRTFHGRTTVIRRGDSVTTLYVVVSGRAQEILYAIDGQAVLLQEYRQGDFFGVADPPHAGAHEGDVVAAERLSTFLLEGSVLAVLAEQHSCIGLALLRLMVRRLQKTTSRMFEQVALSAVGRVHAELLRRAREVPDFTIRPTPILSELALRVSTTRETASRAVNALERRGIIRRDDDALVIVAPHRLEELIL